MKHKKSLKSNCRKNLGVMKQAERGSFRYYRTENGEAHRTGKQRFSFFKTIVFLLKQVLLNRFLLSKVSF